MGSRVFVLLGLMLAVALLISSEVEAAKDLAAQTAETNGVEESKHGGGGGGGHYGGGGGGGHYGGGGGGHGGCRHYCHGRCCSTAEEAELTEQTAVESKTETAETNGVEESKGGYYGGGGGRYGGGGGGRYGGGGGGGGGCRHGNCRGRCCASAAEAKEAQTTGEPQN